VAEARLAVVSGGPSLHNEVSTRLAGVDQRYTAQRRVLIEVLARGGRPMTIAEILASHPDLTQSSAYRNLSALMSVGVIERIAGTDDYGRFELSEALSGHHHHVVCTTCGTVEDLHASPKLERALAEASALAAQEQGYEVTDHRLDLYGLCSSCRSASR
jgi:Fur family transcriptional regulator, ferric uptake regulator